MVAAAEVLRDGANSGASGAVVPPRAEPCDRMQLAYNAPQQPVRRQAPARPRGAQGVLLGEAGPGEGPPGLNLDVCGTAS